MFSPHLPQTEKYEYLGNLFSITRYYKEHVEIIHREIQRFWNTSIFQYIQKFGLKHRFYCSNDVWEAILVMRSVMDGGVTWYLCERIQLVSSDHKFLALLTWTVLFQSSDRQAELCYRWEFTELLRATAGKGDCKRNFKWPFMQRWQSPIYNCTLEITISKMLKILSFF